MKINTTDYTTKSRLSRLKDAEHDRQRLDGWSDLLTADLELLQKSGHAAPEGKFAAARDAVAAGLDTQLAGDVAKRQRHAATVATMAEGIAAGQPPKVPKTQPDPDTTALYEALEKNLRAAHEADMDAYREHWAEWRRADVACVEQAQGDLEAALAAALDAARLVIARRAAVLTLDHEMLSRDPALKAQVAGERRPNAVPWHAATHHNDRILDGVVHALGDLAKQAAASHEFAAADWLPPEDPEHDALRDADVDAGSDWLHRMAQRETGKTCSVCAVAPAAVPVVIEGQWWTVCPACAKANAPEQDASLAEHERRAKASRNGYPEHPDAGAWHAEKAAQVAENAHAAALGGLDDTGDPNAAMIAKRRHSDD